MNAFFAQYGALLLKGTGETLYMTGLATAGSVVFGLPIGILLYTTVAGRMLANAPLQKAFSATVDTLRSVPFLILMVAIMPITRMVTGSSIGPGAAALPLVVAATPFVARLVEASLAEVDTGVIEAALCMGANPLQVVTKVLLTEALPGLVRGLAILAITIIGYSAMGGAVGAGGLGDIAIRYGFHRRLPEVMWASVAIIMLTVWLIQGFLGFAALKIDKKNKI